MHPQITTEAVHNHCKALGLFTNWTNMRKSWIEMKNAQAAAAISK